VSRIVSPKSVPRHCTQQLGLEVARRLGHSVAMLLKRYANCIDGQEQAANGRIAQALEDGGV
jgi:hypothetical protein